MTEAGVRTEETEPGRLLVRLDGEVDLENALTVEEHLREVITNRAESVTLDLGGLDYLDSAGLRVLFALAGRLELLQIALDVVVPVGSPARKAVELSGLGAVVTLRATRCPGAVDTPALRRSTSVYSRQGEAILKRPLTPT